MRIKRFNEGAEDDIKRLVQHNTDRVTYYSQDGISIFRRRTFNQHEYHTLLIFRINDNTEDFVCGVARLIQKKLRPPELKNAECVYTPIYNTDENDDEYEDFGGDFGDIDWLKALIILNKDFKKILNVDKDYPHFVDDLKRYAITSKNLDQLYDKMLVVKKHLDAEVPKLLVRARFGL